MAKIITRAGLNVGTELIIDEPNKTFELVEAGNLNEEDGVTLQVIYSKFVDLWATLTYQDSPFPMNQIDAKSGQYQIGVDAGGNFNGWAPLNDTTRDMMRDGGTEEYDASGTLLLIRAGIVGLGTLTPGSQAYYQRTSISAPADFAFADQVNIGVPVFVDGSFDERTFFKAFVREQGKKFTESVLADSGETETGPYKVSMLLSNEDDPKITDLDSEMSNSPYAGVTVSYYIFSGNQPRTIGGVAYNYDVIISNSQGATLEQIYTKCQYLLRQNADINTIGALQGSVTGKTANLLCNFVGDTLETTLGVFIDDVNAEDSNRIEFQDVTGVNRVNPFEAAGELTFNSVMVQAGSSYRLYYKNPTGAGNDYGESGAITVDDASGNPITGTISNGTISFTFDYDNDASGGTAGTDKDAVLIGIAPGYSKFAVTEFTLSKSKSLKAGLVAEADRGYI